MANGYVSNKPYLAISGGTLQSGMVPGSTVSEGVYVYSVEEGGAAAKAGLQAGDIITKIGDQTISSLDDITALKKSYTAGDTVTVEYYRNNEKQTTELTFDKAPESTVDDTSSSTQQQPTQTYPYEGYGDPWDEFFDYYFGGRGSSYNGSAYYGEAA